MMDPSKSCEDDELMLELSIGGIFGKPKKTNLNTSESIENETKIVDLNVQPKGNIQVLRRRELRRKKKSVDFGSSGSVSGPFVENKEWLDGQIVVQNGEPARKKEKIGDLPEKVGSVSPALVDDGGGQVVAPDGKVNCVSRLTACRSFRPYRGNWDMKSDEHEIDGVRQCCCKMNSNGCRSLAYSDGQSSSHQGGATDDSISNSSNSQLDHQPLSISTASVEPFDQSEQPTKQNVSTTKLTTDSKAVKPNDLSNPHESSVIHPPPKPDGSSHHQQASLLARMPCVLTTGNGPNGKTVSGFLYRCTKNEVSIVCVCHGRLFCPAAFVEHAGGVDIAHPLKHITIFPAAALS